MQRSSPSPPGNRTIGVDRTVMVSLKRRLDRREAFELPDGWPWPVPIIVDAVDGWDLPLPREWRRTDAPAYGCAMSHLQVLEQALEDGVTSLLVLEDDVVFPADFTDRVIEFERHLPRDWRLLMLGGQHVGKPPPEVAPGVVRCRRTQRTHAYLARGEAIELLRATWAGASRHIDHYLKDVQAQLPAYAPAPFLAGQRAGYSDIARRFTEERFWFASPTR